MQILKVEDAGSRRAFLDVTRMLYKDDPNWVCYLDSINYMSFQKEGVYYFTEITKSLKYTTVEARGIALYNFGDGFPIVRTPNNLAKPLVYLGSIDSISDSDSIGKLTKLAVDNFWLNKANNINKSRELLKELKI